MAWIEVHQALTTHRKLKALARALHVRRAVAIGHLACLWLWALDNAPDGDLTDIDLDDIREAADWPKSAAVLIDALVLAGFLDSGSRLTIHDWGDYAGKLIDRRVRNREHMRRTRGQHVDNTWEPRGDLQNSTQPTVPNTTQPPPDTTTDRRPPAPVRTRANDPDFGAVCTAYETDIGMLSLTIAGDIGTMLDEGVPRAAIVEAIEQAARQNKRSWAYVGGIIKRVKAQGYKGIGEAKPDGRVGIGGTTGGLEPATLTVVGSHPGLPDFDWAAAERRREDNEARLAARRAAGAVGAVPPKVNADRREGDQDSELSGSAL